MKKAKSVLSIVAIVLAAVAVVAFALIPVIDFGVATIGASSSGVNPVLNMGGFFEAAFGSISGLFTGIASAFSPLNVKYVAVIVLAVLLVVLFVVALVLVCVKKETKALGLLIPAFVLGLLATIVAGVALIPEPFFTKAFVAYVSAGTVENPIDLYTLIAAGLGFAGSGVALVAMILTVIYAATFKVVKEPKAASAAEPAKEVVVEETIEQKPVEEVLTVAAEAKPEAVAVEKAVEAAKTPEAAKVVRRILVHRSGKVVRVLNEHYYDVTTNIYVEPGIVDPSMPVETEQQHYEKILNASRAQEAAPAPAPAPVVEPVPAPVVEPAPAPVVEPAPAPAPVAEPAPEKVKVERIPFAVRLKEADKALKAAYNELKSEILSYGIKSRISLTGDTFRLHTKTYVKIVIAGKSLKLYFALDPKAYKDSTYPIGDASGKVLHVETPLVFKVKSDLSVRRAKTLIADCAAKDGLVQGEVVAYNHAKDVK